MAVLVSEVVNAPIHRVFDVVSDRSKFAKAVPAIKEVRFLTDDTESVGAKFEETRVMQDGEHRGIVEIIERRPNQLVRLYSAARGIIWDTSIVTGPINAQMTKLSFAVEILPREPKQPFPRKAIEDALGVILNRDLRAIKDWCEGRHRSG